ncbi:cytochrome P450 [Kitasatospora sp. NPDC052896]|uniref:cytochrome P450 n=1 Tax=Kitasatospora sp. NPDC052896 TaxID=3364061 RepID=UPI0037C57F17
MATATSRTTPPPPPELDPCAIRRWREEGGELIDLLTRARALGGVSTLRLGPTPTVLVTDPGAIQHVLAQHADRYVKRSHRLRALLGDGVLSASGEPWKKQRRFLQAHFTGQGIRRFERQMQDAARRTAERWAHAARTGQVRDIGEDLRFFSLDTIWRSLTGHQVDEDTYRQLQVTDTVFAALPPFPPANAGPQPDLTAGLAEIDAVAAGAIAHARANPPGPDGPGLLHTLLAAAAEHPEYTERLIRDELVTLLVAGYETTATTLSWLYLLLAEHPEQRAWALAAGPAGSPARAEAVRALISETLRLYPAAWLMPRYATEDDTLAGHRIEAGSSILTCPYLTHRDPLLWPDPDHFRPRRFLGTDHRPTQPGAYYPFGIGPRACLGMQFALREMTVLLDHLLPAFTPAPRTTVPARAVFAITVHPDGPIPATITTEP